QLDRQPRAADRRRRRLCAIREFRRPGRGHLLLGRRQCQRLGSLEVALDGPLGPAVHVAMTRAGEAALAGLEKRLGHAFADRSLLVTALTHGSATSGSESNYQRLEFLGDRVLALAVADMLIEAFPEAPEGELSPR